MHIFLQIESALFYSHSEHTPKGGRATPYSDSGYAVERTELRSTALRATLQGSPRRALRLSSATSTAHEAELYGSARYAVEPTPSSPTA
ncbi:hypothetical protein [Porphyromonas gingivalis]|uniref:hypothetical protein n=1 Tax=Porphyromonas gingivalis TaxID=837 RepID=UPI000BE7294F|nr:hypothetical protein [Porphyromonas gingivalis]ATS01862.1 hypothetical protein CS059_01880 [Porphyromonas gingivalis]ATS02870.1 hypothetical protein CS059_07700 [Porphyromonas gingivalis]ATS03186.1 hypothetical protein CS059_09565 [Porphyromonas gingivalis]ATS05899.1 hypothetical protein CS387_02150 [Porphyromonas gingivalis]PDP55747.1 hypothetical protein CLI74_08535 [Porphyromonas gingivalis]